MEALVSHSLCSPAHAELGYFLFRFFPKVSDTRGEPNVKRRLSTSRFWRVVDFDLTTSFWVDVSTNEFTFHNIVPFSILPNS